MKLSLLVPCYNAENYIDDFLENLNGLNTSFDEVLFYDDASTDSTFKCLQAKGLQVIEGKVNQGPGYARNQLACQAKGDYIHFHDIDDLMAPNYIDEVKPAAASDNYDVIICNTDWYSTDKREVLLSWKYDNKQLQQHPIAYAIAHPIGGINGLYRKEAFLETGGFNTQIRIWEDADLHVRLAGNQARFLVIEKVLSYAIRYENTASANQALGWSIRLNLLEHYYHIYSDRNTQLTIGREAQRAASNLIIYSKIEAAKKALHLSEQCGIKVPDSRNTIWAVAKFLLPPSVRIWLRLAQLKNAFNSAKQQYA